MTSPAGWRKMKNSGGETIYGPIHYPFTLQVSDLPSILTTELPGGSTPSQYGLPKGAGELQDLIEYRNMNFAMGNIFKAAYRYNNCSHSDALRDLRKIIWFAEREIQRVLKDEVDA